MQKWYEGSADDNGIVISSRVRLARNLKNYPFSPKMSPEVSKKAVEEIKGAVIGFPEELAGKMRYISMEKLGKREKLSMIESHIISPELANKKAACGVAVNDEETLSIMINEEDHIRIQSLCGGLDIEKAWDTADKADDLIEEQMEYAFHKDYGYLASCPTNTGTGLRASVMLHLPLLEGINGIGVLMSSLSKFGMTMRGIYGEGSQPLGSIYQISNQVTLGKSEGEIIESLKEIVGQITEQENGLRHEYLKNSKMEFTDRVYRSYGILAYCKSISSAEAMKLLSDVRMGMSENIIENKKLGDNIFKIMMNIQTGNLEKYIDKEDISPLERDIKRAEYLNKIFGEV